MLELNWKAAERCVTTATPSSDRSLANVKLRLEMSESPSIEQVRHIENLYDWDRFTPELFIDIDAFLLTSDIGLPENAIIIALILRDRDLNKFKKMREWPLTGLPNSAWSLDKSLAGFSRSTRLDVAVVATPHASTTNTNSTFIPKGTVLASKVFKIRAPNYGLDLPFKFVEPDEMARQPGLDQNTVCYLHWKGEDLGRTPAELIEVWLNKELEDKFRALSAKRASVVADYIGRNIAAQVYVDVLGHVLGSDEDSTEPTSLVCIVKDLIERELDTELGELRQLFQRGPDGRARLLPWCWKLTRTDRTFSKLKL